MYNRFLEVISKKGIKSADVAKATGISQTTFSDWKAGRISCPKIDKLAKIAEYLGVSSEYLAGTSDDPSPERKGYYVDAESLRLAQEIYSNPDYKVLFDASQKLSPNDIKFVIQMIERLSQ